LVTGILEVVFQLPSLCCPFLADQIVIVVQILVSSGLRESLSAFFSDSGLHGIEGVDLGQCATIAPDELVSLENQYGQSLTAWSRPDCAVRYRVIGEDEARPLTAFKFGSAYTLDDFVKRSHGWVAVVDEEGYYGEWW
jgi:hypothetical protein